MDLKLFLQKLVIQQRVFQDMKYFRIYTDCLIID